MTDEEIMQRVAIARFVELASKTPIEMSSKQHARWIQLLSEKAWAEGDLFMSVGIERARE